MPSAERRLHLEVVAVKYYSPLLRFFQRRVESVEDAEDLVQEVLSRLARQDLALIENAQGYIFQMAANVLRDRARRASVRTIIIQSPENFDIVDEGSFTPERILQGQEALQIMISALYELPEPVRMVFSLYHFDGVTQVNISRKLGLSLSTVEKYMAKANRHLMRSLRGAI